MKKIIIYILISIIIIGIVVNLNIFNINANNKKVVQEVYEILEVSNIQQNEGSSTALTINYNEEKDIVGIIEIDKIGFEGVIYEGTDIETLDKGVGHFKNSPTFEGNVCLAAHNSKKFWANLNKVKKDDVINYSCVLGTRKYIVFNIQEIKSTEWSLLQDTDKNIITLITCIKNTPDKRLCVQAKEAI